MLYHKMVSMLLLLFLLYPSVAGRSLHCSSFTTPHCLAECTNIPTDIICEAVEDDELISLLTQYGNTSTTPLRLTIRKSPNLHLNQHLFQPVLQHLLDLRLESDTIINEIPRGSFEGLKNLRSLDLTGNKIAHLHAGDFAGLTNLRGLKLERNPLIDLTSGVFESLTSLECLDLDDNALTCDCKLIWMKKWATEHPKLFEDDKELYDEEKENCDGDIPDCEYPPMMKDRNVTEIPADVCDDFLTDLDCLDLQTPHCRTHCDNWTPVQIQCTTVGFEELHNLFLRLSRVVDRVLRVDISKSPNLVLNDSLWQPVKEQLIHLRLDRGGYVLRPGSFAGLSRLVYLEVEDSQVGRLVKGTFEGLTALRGLALDDTDMDHIDEGVFGPLKSLVCLELDDHDEGLCECDMKWLGEWIGHRAILLSEKVLMYDYGVKVFCHGDKMDCSVQKKRDEIC